MRQSLTSVVAMCSMLIGSTSEAWSPRDGCKAEVAAGAFRLDHLQPVGPRGPSSSPMPSDCQGYFVAVFAGFNARQWCMTSTAGDSYHLAASERRGGNPQDLFRVTVSVSRSTGEIIESIWVNTILETRFPCLEVHQADGMTYYFGTKYKDAYSTAPFEGAQLPPNWLVNAAEEIHRFTIGPDRDESQLRQSLLETRDRLFSYYQEHGRH